MSNFNEHLQNGVNWSYHWLHHERPEQKLLDQVKIVAHRGAWNKGEYLENSINAFQRCLNQDIWAIEFDIRWTKDNIPVIHHDLTLKRLFSINKKICDLSYKQLQTYTSMIPSLEQLIKMFSKRVHLFIELKEPTTPEQTLILKDFLSDLKPTQDFHIMSLEPNIFSSFNYPKNTFVTIGLFNIKNIFNTTTRENYGGITGQYLLLNEKIKSKCKELNIMTGTGFPQCKNNFYREVSRGIDWIFTNDALKLTSFKLP
jgi:glycerophosphoryl diester phosphodiesterase